jgi:hypothetical protein
MTTVSITQKENTQLIFIPTKAFLLNLYFSLVNANQAEHHVMAQFAFRGLK